VVYFKYINSPRKPLKNIFIIIILLSIMEAEDDYVEAPILLQKIAYYVA